MTVPLLVSTEWLSGRLGDASVRVADVRWSLLEREKGRNAYRDAHVPGAVFLDLDTELASPRGEGPGRHPLPKPERFAAAMSRAGIGPGIHVIAYDFGDSSTAARLWWLLRYFGHDSVSILDGGFTRWRSEGLPTESSARTYAATTFTPEPRPHMVVNADQVRGWLGDPGTLILDTRARERYEGRTEPIDPVAGHVPGAKSRFYGTNVRTPEDPRFREPEQLRAELTALGAGDAARVVSYCGSGVNACSNLFALRLAGFEDGLLYEGSWSDWCSDASRPMRTGSQP